MRQSSAEDMMSVRRAALDRMARLPVLPDAARPFSGMRLDARAYLAAAGAGDVPDSLVAAVVRRLHRAPGEDGLEAPGVALVSGMAGLFDLAGTRAFHEALFRRVWPRFRSLSDLDGGPAARYRIKTKVTEDGAIPEELYGSAWSFKQLHIDRDAVLFSHVYGPVAGFSGGRLLLVDARTYMRTHRAGFDDLFTWSQESTAGSKPVLRADVQQAVFAECGVDLGVIGPDTVLFLNNAPDAGILHGVTPVRPDGTGGFVRAFHRCSVSRSAGEADGGAY